MLKFPKKSVSKKADPVSDRDRLWFSGLAIFSGLMLFLCFLLIDSLLPVFLALALAYALNPVADALERRGLNRTVAVLTLMLALGLLVAATLAFIMPTLIQEGRDLAVSLPQDLIIVAGRLAEFGNRHGLTLPVGQALVDSLKNQLGAFAFGEGAPGMAMLGRLFSSLGNAAAWSFNLLIVPILFFFFLRDLPAMKRGALA